MTAPLRALVADDDAGIRRVLRLVLLGAGYDVVEATNGAEALERYRAERPELILSDLQMPRLDGIGLLARTRASSPMPSRRGICRSERISSGRSAR